MTTDKASKRAHRSPFQSKHIPSAVFCAAASYRIRSIRTALPARPTCLNSCLIAYRLSKAEGEVEERDESLSSRHATRSRVVSRIPSSRGFRAKNSCCSERSLRAPAQSMAPIPDHLKRPVPVDVSSQILTKVSETPQKSLSAETAGAWVAELESCIHQTKVHIWHLFRSARANSITAGSHT